MYVMMFQIVWFNIFFSCFSEKTTFHYIVIFIAYTVCNAFMTLSIMNWYIMISSNFYGQFMVPSSKSCKYFAIVIWENAKVTILYIITFYYLIYTII